MLLPMYVIIIINYSHCVKRKCTEESLTFLSFLTAVCHTDSPCSVHCSLSLPSTLLPTSQRRMGGAKRRGNGIVVVAGVIVVKQLGVTVKATAEVDNGTVRVPPGTKQKPRVSVLHTSHRHRVRDTYT